jgi:hypothetical protein
MDFMKTEPDPDGELYSYYNESGLNHIQEDKAASVMKFPLINSEYEVRYMFACPVLILFSGIFTDCIHIYEM